jgi:hypothetical protein
MKSIEYCLDVVLRKLRDNWDKNPLPPLEADNILEEFELSKERHEFYRSLINMLIDDGYADFLYSPPLKDRRDLDMGFYQTKPILTARGYYFIDQGGYTQKKINDSSLEAEVNKATSFQLSLASKLNFLTLWIAGGTIGLALIELTRMALENHWFSCH